LKQQQNRVFAFCSSQTIIFPSRLMTGVTILQLDQFLKLLGISSYCTYMLCTYDHFADGDHE